MKLLEAIQQVKRPEITNPWAYDPPLDALTSALDMSELWDYDEERMKRLRAYPLFMWQCTDEVVGLEALYFDDEPVAALFRRGRKWPYEISWVSAEQAEAVRAFLMSFADPHMNLTFLDPQAEVDVEELRYLAGREVELEIEP